TYLNAGLPPEPICNPGLASIKAAAKPADVEYLYFFAQGDGTHHFSRTYQEHLDAQKR
ncbi:MAG TPA: endolytic transglycosylase MltG, partial [Bacillota bacterium]|nr:endolytic transglycosylase MltG [Bacillota bacterium]